MTANPTPRPWIASKSTTGDLAIHGADLNPWQAPWDFARCVAAVRGSESADANAKLIVSAVNSYDAYRKLAEAARLALHQLTELTSERFALGEDKPSRDALTEALAAVDAAERDK